MSRRVRQTKKQRELMGLILRKAGEGVFLTIQELHEQVSYGKTCSYGAIRMSVYQLEEAGMVARQRNGRNMEVAPTAEAYHWFVPKQA